MFNIGDYVLDVSGNCYVIGKLAKTMSKGKKIEYVADAGYYGKLDAALTAIRRRMRRDAVGVGKGGLPELIECVKESDARFNELLKESGIDNE